MGLDFIERASDFINVENIEGVLALIDNEGYPTASAITLSKNDGIKWMTFCTNTKSNKVQRINNCNKASVCFYSVFPLFNITLVGKIMIINDLDIKREMWYEECKYHWSNYQSEQFSVLKFVTERYCIMIDEETVEGVF